MSENTPAIERQSLTADIVCVGFGPASAGFLSSLNSKLTEMNPDGTPVYESRAMPGMPLQVLCYERADDISFGVSGIVTRARSIRETLPDLDAEQIPMAENVTEEKVVYLLDPHGASRRSFALRMIDKLISLTGKKSIELPYIPPFLRKHDGLLLSIGQFNQWVGAQIMAGGFIQLWPGTPVKEALIQEGQVRGVQLIDQGTDKDGNPSDGFMPGMNIEAELTVVGDGPVGNVGRQLDQEFGMPEGNQIHEWAVGMKMVVELPENTTLKPGMVLHTIGFPEPEIFGFLYVFDQRIASLGIFVPSWFDNPARTAYRYLQHWMLHPYLWQHLEGGSLLSWGAKSLQESGKRGEPHLVGEGYARIGEGSGSTNVLTGSGVDEAWATGSILGEGILELIKTNQPLNKENLDKVYVQKRRESWVEKEGLVAEKSRDGFATGVVTGMIGMALTGLTGGKLNMPGKVKRPHEHLTDLESYFKDKITPEKIQEIIQTCKSKGLPIHDALMTESGWPEIPLDGKLLVSHQDALLMGGKVQAPPGFADHVRFLCPDLCEKCGEQVCVEMCSGQAISRNPEAGVPLFDREKCVHCGACIWNCTSPHPEDENKTNIEFTAGAGGLHSAQN